MCHGESEKTTRERRARVRWEVRAARTGAADLERIGEDNCRALDYVKSGCERSHLEYKENLPSPPLSAT